MIRSCSHCSAFPSDSSTMLPHDDSTLSQMVPPLPEGSPIEYQARDESGEEADDIEAEPPIVKCEFADRTIDISKIFLDQRANIFKQIIMSTFGQYDTKKWNSTHRVITVLSQSNRNNWIWLISICKIGPLAYHLYVISQNSHKIWPFHRQIWTRGRCGAGGSSAKTPERICGKAGAGSAKLIAERVVILRFGKQKAEEKDEIVEEEAIGQLAAHRKHQKAQEVAALKVRKLVKIP